MMEGSGRSLYWGIVAQCVMTDINVSLDRLQTYTPNQFVEPWIRAKAIHRRVDLEIGYFPPAILKASFQPLKRLILIAECGIRESKTISGNVSLPGKFVQLSH